MLWTLGQECVGEGPSDRQPHACIFLGSPAGVLPDTARHPFCLRSQGMEAAGSSPQKDLLFPRMRAMCRMLIAG